MQKESMVQEIEDRIHFLQGKLNSLEHDLLDQRNGDVDIFPNRENPFKERETANQANTHSL